MSYLGKAFWVYFVSIALFLLVILILAANDAGGIVGAMFLMYPGLIVSMASGLFGATFSMLVNTTKRSAEGTLESLERGLELAHPDGARRGGRRGRSHSVLLLQQRFAGRKPMARAHGASFRGDTERKILGPQ